MFSIGKSDCKSAEFSVMIIRADGSKEDLGVVSYYDRNPIKQAIWNCKNWVKKTFFNFRKGN